MRTRNGGLRLRGRLAMIGVGAALVSLVATSVAQADSVVAAPAQPTNQAALFMLDSTYGGNQGPLYFQVIGQGFRPGEAVTLQASVVGDVSTGGDATPLQPVNVTANDYGQIAATIDGAGIMGPSDGFIIRALGDEHAASIIDFVLTSPAVQPGGAN